MIISKRSFVRQEPFRDATKIYIFSEGKKREYDYFLFFEGLDSRINVIVNKLDGCEDNSPTGLCEISSAKFKENDEYEFIEGDQVWLVFDTDDWGAKINEAREYIKEKKDWFIAQSNPCFEVWLYYHFRKDFPELAKATDKGWKAYVNDAVPGGFNPTKHPSLLSVAIENAESNFRKHDDGSPEEGCSEVFFLGKRLLPYVSDTIQNIKNREKR